jgi:plastocyanin
MRKSAIVALIIIVVVIMVCGGVYLAMQARNDNSDTTQPANNSDMSNMEMNNDTTNPQATATNSVSIANMAFAPANITVKKGTTVTWTNNDTTTHTVTENDGHPGPDSGPVQPGQTYNFTYDTAGTFKYHCAIHPNMVGTVTVIE